MSSNCINLYMDGFYTSIAFQRYQEHSNRSSNDKVMALQSWYKNKGLQQRRDVAKSAETEHPDITTLLHNVAMFGVGGGTFLGGLEGGKHPRAWFSMGKKMKIEEEIWASFITLGYFFSLFMFYLIFMVVSFLIDGLIFVF